MGRAAFELRGAPSIFPKAASAVLGLPAFGALVGGEVLRCIRLVLWVK